MVKPREERYLKVKTPFSDDTSGLGIIKLLGLNMYGTLAMKVKSETNKAYLDATNDSTKAMFIHVKRTVVI